MRTGAGLRDRHRGPAAPRSDPRHQLAALRRVGEAGDKEPRDQLPPGERRGETEFAGRRRNRPFGLCDRPVAVERRVAAGKADLEQTGLGHRYERIGAGSICG